VLAVAPVPLIPVSRGHLGLAAPLQGAARDLPVTERREGHTDLGRIAWPAVAVAARQLVGRVELRRCHDGPCTLIRQIAHRQQGPAELCLPTRVREALYEGRRIGAASLFHGLDLRVEGLLECGEAPLDRLLLLLAVGHHELQLPQLSPCERPIGPDGEIHLADILLLAREPPMLEVVLHLAATVAPLATLMVVGLGAAHNHVVVTPHLAHHPVLGKVMHRVLLVALPQSEPEVTGEADPAASTGV